MAPAHCCDQTGESRVPTKGGAVRGSSRATGRNLSGGNSRNILIGSSRNVGDVDVEDVDQAMAALLLILLLVLRC